MSKRDVFIAKMKSQLDEWKAELHKLESKAADAEAGARDKYHEAIEELRGKRAVAEAKLAEIRHAGEDAWEEIEEEAEKTWKALVVSVDAFRDFSDHS